MLKIVHSADLHLDSPFASFPVKERQELNAELNNCFGRLIQYCIDTQADILLLAGDIFDAENPSEEAVALFRRETERLENTRVFVALGNHDCGAGKIASERVHVFSESLEKVALDELNACVWGQSFSPNGQPPLFKGIEPEKGRINVLCLHGNLGGTDYAPIAPSLLAVEGLSYVALGHKHAFSESIYGKTRVCYSGCIMGRGFDETGEKGFARADVDENGANVSFVPAGGVEFRERELYLNDFADEGEMLDFAASSLNTRELCRLRLHGGELPVAYIEKMLREKAFHLEILRQSVKVPDGPFYKLLENVLRDNPTALDIALNALVGSKH